MRKSELKYGMNITEPVKITVDDKIILAFSYPEELEQDLSRLKAIQDSISEIKEALNKWAKSSDDQFFAIITPDCMPVEFQKITEKERTTDE